MITQHSDKNPRLQVLGEFAWVPPFVVPSRHFVHEGLGLSAVPPEDQKPTGQGRSQASPSKPGAHTAAG